MNRTTTLAISAGIIIGLISRPIYRYLSNILKARNRKLPSGVLDGPTALVGDTPMIYLPRISQLLGCKIYAKCEFMNPGGSSKDRIALSILKSFAQQGKLSSGSTVYEGTVGSTGISLAWIAISMGFNCHICIPDDQAQEKFMILEKLGAQVTKVRPASIVDPGHFVNTARRLASEDPRGVFIDQFENLDNFRAHYGHTGPEIYQQTDRGQFNVLLMGAGTGGTLAGCSRYLKELMPDLKIVLADPQGSGLFNKVRSDVFYSNLESEGKRRRHQVDTVVEGVGINRMTKNLSMLFGKNGSKLIDDAVSVTDKEVVSMSRFIMKTEGLFLGSSSCVNLAAVVKYVRQLSPEQARELVIVTVLPDNGNRHMTKFWNDDYLIQNGIVSREELQSRDQLFI